MIDLVFFFKFVIRRFLSHKISSKKRSRNIYIFSFKKVISIKRSICVIDTFYVKYFSVLKQYYKIQLLIEITFLSKKKSRSFFM